MRKVMLWGFVLVAVSILCFLNVTPIERRTLNPDDSIAPTAATTKPMPMQVTNFPATQNVAGAVNVGNLPTVQQVAGSVAVSNLPLDGDGNVKVAAQMGSTALVAHYVGLTQASLPVTATVLDLSRACNSEFPGSRLCDLREIFREIPPPDPWPTRYVWLMVENVGGFPNGLHARACFDSLSTGNPVADCNAPPPFPAVCCGY